MGDPHAAGRDWIIWWYWGVQILPPVTAPAIPRRGRVEVIQWGLSCKCTRRSPNTDAEQPSWPLLFCFMWFFSLVFWFLFLIFNLVDTYDSYEIIGTAGVVVSCKIPILTTRVRFPGSAHIFRPVKYTVHDLVDIKLWLALYFWLMSVCEYTVSIGADWFDCTTINPNIKLDCGIRPNT